MLDQRVLVRAKTSAWHRNKHHPEHVLHTKTCFMAHRFKMVKMSVLPKLLPRGSAGKELAGSYASKTLHAYPLKPEPLGRPVPASRACPCLAVSCLPACTRSSCPPRWQRTAHSSTSSSAPLTASLYQFSTCVCIRHLALRLATLKLEAELYGLRHKRATPCCLARRTCRSICFIKRLLLTFSAPCGIHSGLSKYVHFSPQLTAVSLQHATWAP